jgi:hypothetical protein
MSRQCYRIAGDAQSTLLFFTSEKDKSALDELRRRVSVPVALLFSVS